MDTRYLNVFGGIFMDSQYRYNAIFFDAGGVLFDTKIHRNERIRNILRARDFQEADIKKALSEGDEFSKIYLKTGPWLDNWEKEEVYWDKYYETILNSLGTDYNYSFKRELLYQTHYAGHCELFNEVKDVLENLYGSYKLAVISNAFPSMEWVFDLLDIRRYFKSITISSFAGISKPEAGIYKFGLNSLGVKPEECVFIDDKDINVKAAEKIGFKGLYLDRKKEDLQALLKQIGA